MGYERTFRLAVTNRFNPQETEKLKELLKTEEMKYKFLFKERCKWYDFVIDMRLLSKSFPNTLFYGAYIGEDIGDNEYVIFHRGCSMPAPDTFAFKLPLNEKVIELTKEFRAIEQRGPDENHDSDEEKEDELTVKRENLIDEFFSQLNLVEISDLFALEQSEESEESEES